MPIVAVGPRQGRGGEEVRCAMGIVGSEGSQEEKGISRKGGGKTTSEIVGYSLETAKSEEHPFRNLSGCEKLQMDAAAMPNMRVKVEIK